MAKKKHTTERVDFYSNVILAFYVAVILLGVEGIRFFVGTFFRPFNSQEFVAYIIPWGVAVVLLAFLINGFSKNIENNS